METSLVKDTHLVGIVNDTMESFIKVLKYYTELSDIVVDLHFSAKTVQYTNVIKAIESQSADTENKAYNIADICTNPFLLCNNITNTTKLEVSFSSFGNLDSPGSTLYPSWIYNSMKNEGLPLTNFTIKDIINISNMANECAIPLVYNYHMVVYAAFIKYIKTLLSTIEDNVGIKNIIRGGLYDRFIQEAFFINDVLGIDIPINDDTKANSVIHTLFAGVIRNKIVINTVNINTWVVFNLMNRWLFDKTITTATDKIKTKMIICNRLVRDAFVKLDEVSFPFLPQEAYNYFFNNIKDDNVGGIIAQYDYENQQSYYIDDPPNSVDQDVAMTGACPAAPTDLVGELIGGFAATIKYKDQQAVKGGGIRKTLPVPLTFDELTEVIAIIGKGAFDNKDYINDSSHDHLTCTTYSKEDDNAIKGLGDDKKKVITLLEKGTFVLADFDKNAKEGFRKPLIVNSSERALIGWEKWLYVIDASSNL